MEIPSLTKITADGSALIFSFDRAPDQADVVALKDVISATDEKTSRFVAESGNMLQNVSYITGPDGALKARSAEMEPGDVVHSSASLHIDKTNDQKYSTEGRALASKFPNSIRVVPDTNTLIAYPNGDLNHDSYKGARASAKITAEIAAEFLKQGVKPEVFDAESFKSFDMQRAFNDLVKDGSRSEDQLKPVFDREAFQAAIKEDGGLAHDLKKRPFTVTNTSRGDGIAVDVTDLVRGGFSSTDIAAAFKKETGLNLAPLVPSDKNPDQVVMAIKDPVKDPAGGERLSTRVYPKEALGRENARRDFAKLRDSGFTISPPADIKVDTGAGAATSFSH